MDGAGLATAEYWESDDLDLRLNPRRMPDTSGLLEFLSGELEITRSVVLATSGSSGSVKFVILSKAALLASAESVSTHLNLSQDDSWLASLSDFHVGGLGIYARCFHAGVKAIPFPSSPWDRTGSAFCEALITSQARWTSLTPTHLHDLVEHEMTAPESLRGLLLGGGRIDPILVERASQLGWPVRASYGMTEAASQVATGPPSEATWLNLLPGWEVATGDDNRVKLRGDALFSGYAMRNGNRWCFDTARDEEGWFVTGDCGEISEGRLRHLGRADDLVKVLGELVSVSQVEAKLAERQPRPVAVCAIPESRRGHELIAVLEGEAETEPSIDQINEDLSGLEEISQIVAVRELPRTEIGKLDRGAIQDLINQS